MSFLLPLRLFEVGNPDWRPLGWLHALIVIALTMLIIWHAGGVAWVRHFSFPVCFILVAVPWVTPVETPIVQGLMRIVAAIASETLALFGIPAQLEGSVIRISSGIVGVNEACSGVRSLQTSLMIGLLFGELKRVSVGHRVLLVAGAIGMAFVANCARAFFLVWIAATRNLSQVDQWHDTAGYAIVGLVFVVTVALASLLAKGTNTRTNIPHSAFRIPHFVIPASAVLVPLIWLLVVELAVEGWYRWHERNLVATSNWDVAWPESAPDYRNLPISDEVRAMLRFDRGREASWRQPFPGSDLALQPAPLNCFMFFFRWEAGKTNILRARSHRPDICLPSIGWKQRSDVGARDYLVRENFSLPFRHFVFTLGKPGQPEVIAHTFFCLREDKRRSASSSGTGDYNIETSTGNDWTRSDRMRVVREGRRNQGQQVLQVVLVTPQTLDARTAEAEFAGLVPQLVK